MRLFTSTIAAVALFSAAAFAQDHSMLPAGKPAGVKQAEIGTTALVVIGVGVLVAVAVAVASSSNGSPLQTGSNPPAVVNTTTSTA